MEKQSNATDPTEEVEFISNLTIWAPSCSISLWKDKENQYNAAINLILTEDPIRCITTITNIWCTDPLCVIRQAFDCVHRLYDDVNDDVLVFDHATGENIETTYTVTEAFDFDGCGADQYQQQLSLH